jgi:NAD(P)H dehydrogenase (quinone)
LEHGTLLGCAGDGRISSAERADFAAAAVAVLLLEDQAGRIYELAGDDAYTMTELADEVTKQSGKKVVYNDMPEAEYRKVLIDSGLPQVLAVLLSNSDTGASKGGLFDGSRQLSKLIGRPTTPLKESIAAAMKG